MAARRRRSEEREDGARNTIGVVDGEERAPLVEGRAGMRTAAADQIADADIGFLRNAKVGMLIVHRGDFLLRDDDKHVLSYPPSINN